MQKFVLLVLLCFLLLSTSIMAVEVDVSIEEELWFPSVKMESYNSWKADDWDPAIQVFDGNLNAIQTTVNLDFNNNWGAKVLFNYSDVSSMNYPEHRFGGNCSCELDISPSGTMDAIGGDLIYSLNNMFSITAGYRNYLLLLGAEGVHQDDDSWSDNDKFLKEFGIRTEGMRIGGIFKIPLNDKFTIKSNIGFYPYITGKEAARWICRDRSESEQYQEVLSNKHDEEAFDADLKFYYSVNQNLNIFLGYKYQKLSVNQIKDLQDETINREEFEDYARWYDQHDATLSGLTLGCEYTF